MGEDILWHRRKNVTLHYSQAQVLEVRRALKSIRAETGRENRSLTSLAREARKERVSSESLPQGKTGQLLRS